MDRTCLDLAVKMSTDYRARGISFCKGKYLTIHFKIRGFSPGNTIARRVSPFRSGSDLSEGALEIGGLM